LIGTRASKREGAVVRMNLSHLQSRRHYFDPWASSAR